MSSLSSYITPEIQMAAMVFVGVLVFLYILSVIWSCRDASSRGIHPALGLVSVIPLIGIIAYCLLRPGMLEADKTEQNLDLALKERQLQKYGECGHCGYPVESEYVLCPNCHQRLKNLCPTCHHALNPEWSVCPYCTTQIR